jgi:hypothetical protein
MSLHINELVDKAELREFLLGARPALVKTMKFDKEFWSEIKREHPFLEIMCRVYQNDDEMRQRVMADPEAAARWYVQDHILHNIGPITDLVYGVETINEMATHDIQRWLRQGEYDWWVAELLQPYGIRSIAGNFGVGHPSGTMEEMRERITQPDVIEAYAHPNTVAIGAHAYCAPILAAEDLYKPGDKDWFCLRHRRWYPMLPPEAQKPVFIGEAGVDGGIGPQDWPGVVEGGWKTNIGDVDEYIFGENNIPWLDARLQEDDYVIGATLFAYVPDDDEHWTSFNHRHDTLVKLGEYIKSQHGEPDDDWVQTMRNYLLAIQGTASDALAHLANMPSGGPDDLDTLLSLAHQTHDWWVLNGE